MRGRKPKPTALKKLQGNPGRRPLPKGEPHPEVKVPDCPEFLSASAKEEWARISKELEAVGLVTEVDRGALTAYCSAWAEVERAERELQKGGYEVTLIATVTGREYKKVSPWVKILKDARKQMIEALREFGMSPSSRARVTAVAKEKEPAGVLVAFDGGKK